MVARNMPWPAEWVDLLRERHLKGYSASTIATAINAKFRSANITRNAVIGKILRLGLKRDEAFNARNRAAAREAGQKRVREKGARATARTTTQFGKGVHIATPSAPPPPPPPRIPTVHVSTFTGAIIPGPSTLPPQPLPAPDKAPHQHITTSEITAKTCCWPLNDGAPEWLFCGDARDAKSGVGRERGYCTTHWHKSLGKAA